ncbi:hypothetical protein ELH96_19730 [Rhizobium leguminosarum]|nr:hypothetical protein ELH96_19730 [Rhizobium leguminosarum]
MSRRKGELTPAAIDRGWPFQVALPAELSKGKLGEEQALYCNRLMRCSRGHTVFHEDQHYNIHCFATKVGAEAFMAKYGGEWFDPRDRGRGADWNKWFKGRAASKPVSCSQR